MCSSPLAERQAGLAPQARRSERGKMEDPRHEESPAFPSGEKERVISQNVTKTDLKIRHLKTRPLPKKKTMKGGKHHAGKKTCPSTTRGKRRSRELFVSKKSTPPNIVWTLVNGEKIAARDRDQKTKKRGPQRPCPLPSKKGREMQAIVTRRGSLSSMCWEKIKRKPPQARWEKKGYIGDSEESTRQ